MAERFWSDVQYPYGNQLTDLTKAKGNRRDSQDREALMVAVAVEVHQDQTTKPSGDDEMPLVNSAPIVECERQIRPVERTTAERVEFRETSIPKPSARILGSLILVISVRR